MMSLLIAGVGAAVAGGAQAAVYLSALGSTIRAQRRSRIVMRPGTLRELPQFDHSALDALTHELQGLGFDWLGDVISTHDLDTSQPDDSEGAPRASKSLMPEVRTQTTGLLRVTAHPEHSCYGTLISCISETSPSPGSEHLMPQNRVTVAPFRTAVTSLSGSGDAMWAYGTSNRERQAISRLHRHPRVLGARLPGANAGHLLAHHLQRRGEVARAGGFAWDPQTSAERYMAYEDRVVRHLRAVYAGMSTLKAARGLLGFHFDNSAEWLGELAGR